MLSQNLVSTWIRLRTLYDIGVLECLLNKQIVDTQGIEESPTQIFGISSQVNISVG